MLKLFGIKLKLIQNEYLIMTPTMYPPDKIHEKCEFSFPHSPESITMHKLSKT